MVSIVVLLTGLFLSDRSVFFHLASKVCRETWSKNLQAFGERRVPLRASGEYSGSSGSVATHHYMFPECEVLARTTFWHKLWDPSSLELVHGIRVPGYELSQKV